MKPGDDDELERELLRRVEKRDREAFAEIYRRYQPRLWSYLCRIIGDQGAVEEVIDDVLFAVWRSAGKFRGAARVSSWIFGIAYRQALSRRRRDSRNARMLHSACDPEELPSAEPPADDRLASALACLSADHRQVVVLAHVSGFSYQEIATIAGCPVNTVKTRMYHARRRLQKLLPRLDGRARKVDRARA